MADKLAPSKRHAFKHEGRVVYEWDQTLEDLNLYVRVPPGVSAKQLDVKIATGSVAIGIRGNPPYMAHDLAEKVKTEECFWTLEAPSRDPGEVLAELEGRAAASIRALGAD